MGTSLERPGRYALRIVYLVAIVTSLSLLFETAQTLPEVTVVYPTTGIGFGLIWALGIEYWPIVLISQFVTSYFASDSLWVASVVALVELVTAIALWRLLQKSRVSSDLARLRDLGMFAGWSFLITGLAAGVIVVAEWTYGEGGVARVLSDGAYWWISDAVSLLIFAPLINTWRRWPFSSPRQFRVWLGLSLVLVALGLGIVTIGDAASVTLFLLVPFVVFAAMIGGVSGAASSGAILMVVLLAFAFVHPPNQVDMFIRVVFVATATATGYILGIVWGEKERVGRQLAHLARHDTLTGMFNRFEFDTRLRTLMDAPARSLHALLFIDLDRFKLVNDTCGHMAGDRMLQELAHELEIAAPSTATMARLGGDEFGCILPDSDEAKATGVANAMHSVFSRYRFQVGEMDFSVGASIGITLFPATEGDTPESVVARSDVACYLAKEEGGNHSRVYRPEDESMIAWHSAIQEVSQLERALESGRFALYRQRIVDIRPDARGDEFHEILLRLDQNGEKRSAAEFIPLAQRLGLMDRIDHWVLEHACEYASKFGEPNLRLGVNVSGSTLNQPAFYDFVAALPGRYGIRPGQICLEITEAVAPHRLRQAVTTMQRLREHGFDVALDDFGAGVASFGYLHELPVSMVKLDGRFVRDLRSDPASAVIVESLVRLATIRGITCVAEWVDSQETIDRLRKLGVAYAQGYFVAAPRPLEDLVM